MKTSIGTVLRTAILLITATTPAVAQNSSTPFKVDVLATSPVVTDTDMQILCLFRATPKNKLDGALTLTDNALKGLLAQVRGQQKFGGLLGETLLITPPPGTMKAKHLLLIGMGDSETFSPERMRLIGKIVVRESDRLGVSHPYFAPTVKDGGVSKFTTGQISEQVILGARDAYSLAQYLQTQNADSGPKVTQITYLAGKEYASTTQDGITKAFAAQVK